ncbi:MAG: phage protease [Marinomonas foliarum]|uniref:phage protease n=1 Tax=Marinomonas foliarum TaxID=491950 RepID=UPI003F987624
METKRTALSLAILSGTKPTDEVGFAALSLKPTEDGWCQLLPAGYFKAVDGRPFDVASGQWFLDEPTGQLLIADLKSRVNSVVIDYEHQTLLADQNGQPAPASGWIKDAQWRESGLWIKPDWTGRARDFIANEEYRYLSAVFPYDKQTGKPISLHSAALVNRPGLDGLNGVALRSLHIHPTQAYPDQQEESLMDRKLLIKQLGLADDATDEQITVALKEAMTAQAALKASQSELAALKATPPATSASVDLSKYVPIEIVTDMQTQLAVLSARVETGGLDKLIDDAKADGRLLPSMEQWARDLGKDNFAALKTFIDKAKPLAALKKLQAGDELPPSKTDVHGLTDDELQAAELTGRTPEQYAALKAQ